MAIATKKYVEACKMFPDFKGKKPLEVYSKMAQKSYEWNSLETRWESESEKEELPVININIKCQNALIDDAIEQLVGMLQDYEFEVLNTPKPYPAKERDAKGNLNSSKTHSTAYIQYRFPDTFGDSEEIEADDSELADE